MEPISLNSFSSAALQTPRLNGAETAVMTRLEARTSGAGSGEDFAAMLKTAAQESKKPVIDKADKLYEQCEALENILLKTLITGMRKTVQKSELTKNSFAGDMYEDMLYDEYAKNFTHNTQFGLAELAYLELSGQRGKLMRRPEM